MRSAPASAMWSSSRCVVASLSAETYHSNAGRPGTRSIVTTGRPSRSNSATVASSGQGSQTMPPSMPAAANCGSLAAGGTSSSAWSRANAACAAAIACAMYTSTLSIRRSGSGASSKAGMTKASVPVRRVRRARAARLGR